MQYRLLCCSAICPHEEPRRPPSQVVLMRRLRVWGRTMKKCPAVPADVAIDLLVGIGRLHHCSSTGGGTSRKEPK